jgi:hypothetical protein
MEKWGEEAAKQSIAFAKWLGNSVAGKLRNKDKILLQSLVGSCTVDFVIDFAEAEAVVNATTQAMQHGSRAAALVEALAKYCPLRVVFAYDQKAAKWFPKFAVTRLGGVITDQPWLIAIDVSRGGLSLGGTRPRVPAPVTPKAEE